MVLALLRSRVQLGKDRGIQEPSQRIDELASKVIGAAIEVHRSLGTGYLESVYEEALSVELTLRGLRHATQVTFSLRYKDHDIGVGRIDLLVEDELKAVESLAPIHSAQVISYLKAPNKELALLINFNDRLLKDGIKRIVLS